MSVVGGQADVARRWSELLLLAKSRSSGDTGKMLFTFRRAKPDAGNRHVRFDERGGETGSRQAGLRRRRESAGHCHRKPTATAPLLDSTSGLVCSPSDTCRDGVAAVGSVGRCRTTLNRSGPLATPPGRSAPGPKADQMRQKADIDARMSAAGGLRLQSLRRLPARRPRPQAALSVAVYFGVPRRCSSGGLSVLT